MYRNFLFYPFPSPLPSPPFAGERGRVRGLNLIKGTLEISSRIDILVNNAGVAGPVGNIEDLTVEQWEGTMAVEVGNRKIRVNAICPGGVMGPRLDFVIDSVMKGTGKTREQVTTEFTEASALKSFVDAKYIAAVVAFLCSEDAAMITGQDINVDAGTVMY